jgi:hypothetical protein
MVDKWVVSDFTAVLAEHNVLLTEETVPESMYLIILSLKRGRDKARERERRARNKSRR